jgi:hypothetical protein
VAVCDVKRAMRERAKQAVDTHYGNKDCVVYNDFRELLDRQDIDAVTIATLDSWHVVHALAAVRAGKDLYLEKPMGMSIEEILLLREAAHRYGRVFQFGTQQRSSQEIRLPVSTFHQGNFLECVRSRQKTICNIDVAVRSDTVCQLAWCAFHLQRKLQWDPDQERFVNDPEANRKLTRALRAPWHL